MKSEWTQTFVLASLTQKSKVLRSLTDGTEELCWTDRWQFGKLVRQLLLRLTSQVNLPAYFLGWLVGQHFWKLNCRKLNICGFNLSQKVAMLRSPGLVTLRRGNLGQTH